MAEDAPWERLIGSMDAVHRDTSSIQAVSSTNVPQILSELKSINTKLDSIVSAMSKGTLGGSSRNPSGGPSRSVSAINPALSGAGGTASGSAPGGVPSGGSFSARASAMSQRITGTSGLDPSDPRGGFMRAQGIAGGFQAAAQVAGVIGSAVNRRIESGAEYSLSADKMNVMYQQMYGMSQQKTQDTFRYPLTGYRLGGPGAINDLLAMQARTGISATNQVSSIAAMRASSGYSLSAGDAANMVSTLGSAQVANRMFMTTGQSLYGIGGKENTSLSVIQNIIKSAGLTDPKMLKGAMQQGSATRMRLDFMGLPQDMQDFVLQYAQQNATFQKKGGQGFYDPSKAQDRKRMGIEENYSTQKEETDRIKGKREEDFYNRQQDNLAALEKQTQSLIQIFGKLEDKLSGILGILTKNKAVTQIGSSALKTFGGAAMGIGGAMMATGNPFGGLVMGAGGIASVLGGFFGDPVDGQTPKGTSAQASSGISGDANKTPVQLGRKGSIPFGSLGSISNFSKMHPTMQTRVKSLILASGGRVGWGGGFRTSQAQETLFKSRYTPVNPAPGEDLSQYSVWNGQYYKHTSGAPAAPPGMSMHEVGLAADLVGDMDWIVKNAHRFGLQHFNDVNGEPWHVQPKELPRSRKEYEKQGAPWGHGEAVFNANDVAALPPGAPPNATPDYGETSPHSGSGIESLGQMGIKEIMESLSSKNASIGSSSGGSSYGVSSNGLHSVGTVDVPTGAGALNAKQMVALLRGAGFPNGEKMQKALGIAWRESRWNPRSYNPGSEGSLPENSFGLFQFNMLPLPNRTTENRFRMYGISSREELYDPATSARAAKVEMVDRDSFSPWYAKPGGGWDPNGKPGSELIGWDSPITDLSTAAAVIADADRTGDPVFNNASRPAMGSSTTNVSAGTTFNISPTVNIVGGNGFNGDLQAAARMIGDLLRKEVALSGFRSE